VHQKQPVANVAVSEPGFELLAVNLTGFAKTDKVTICSSSKKQNIFFIPGINVKMANAYLVTTV